MTTWNLRNTRETHKSLNVTIGFVVSANFESVCILSNFIVLIMYVPWTANVFESIYKAAVKEGQIA